ncbi:type III pantothenate kinase [Winogradskyella aurantiaca]|uniref:type III pantothenate kinase n=1 Tax=Winogradskyella aurantiaca TaxID=2219558 RepID=UPI000E1DF5B2|nr:type III pantothenate kinase [Winogradskyella aurantiaca]
MKLVLDVGNTTTKFGVFNNDNLVETGRIETKSIVDDIKSLLSNSDITAGIISNVGHLDSMTMTQMLDFLPIHQLSAESNLPFKNNYSTPETLGVDRIALVSAAMGMFPETNCLIIDAGTCITYDFVNHNKVYHGGAISPGLRIRYESLHNFTAKLPLLEKKVPKDLTGDSTQESMHSGVVLGTIKEIDGVIEAYRARYSHLTVILTGGDSKFLSDQLKNSIFANSNFLLTGLNYLLDYNTLT